MATRKNRPVLYEVAGLGRRQRESSWRRRFSVARTPAVAEPATSSSPASPATAGPAETPPRSLRFADGHLFVELGWAGMSVAAIGLLFILWVTFEAGQRYSRTRSAAVQPAPTENTGHQAEPAGAPARPPELTPGHRPSEPAVSPASRAPQEASSEPKPTPAGPVAEPKFQYKPGYRYLVIQHFPRSVTAAAEKAALFLRAGGVDCVIIRGDDLMLIATQPFLLDQKDAKAERQRCDALKARILALGKEYKEKNGYAFEQCREKLMVPGRP